MPFIKVDMSEIEELASKFQLFARRAYPFATKDTVNNAAFKTRAVAKQNIRTNFVLRNKRTLHGIQVAKATGLRVSDQEAHVGSRDEWMARQEFGGVIVGTGKRGKPIYTAEAAGLPEGTSPVTRLPVKKNRLGKRGTLRLSTRRQGRTSSKQQRAAIAVKQAVKSGKRHVFLDLPRTQGIFLIKGRGKKKKVRMVHNLSHKVVTTPASPWLGPAVSRVQRMIPQIYKKALIEQARRHHLFGW